MLPDLGDSGGTALSHDEWRALAALCGATDAKELVERAFAAFAPPIATATHGSHSVREAPAGTRLTVAAWSSEVRRWSLRRRIVVASCAVRPRETLAYVTTRPYSSLL